MDGYEPGVLLIPDVIQEGDEVTMRMRNSITAIGWLVAASVAMGLVSPAHATTVLWYGKNCTDENGGVLKNGVLVQLIRSSDSTIGTPDTATGAPTGNDVVCATASYECDGSRCRFQGEDWKETAGAYLCVRIWNAGDAVSGTYYWDSPVFGASGMLPVDIDCLGARTDKRK